MTAALFLALLLALQMSPAPAAAQPSMDAQCEAWICLPGGFGPAECTPAKAAVDWRLSRVPPLDPLPPWSSCATHYAAIQSNLRFDNHYRPPRCGRSTGHGTVWVRVDGNRVGSQYDYTRQEPVRPCPPPPPPTIRPPTTDPTTPDPTTPTTTDPTTPTTTTTDPITPDTTITTTTTTILTDPCVINPASCINGNNCPSGNCDKEEDNCPSGNCDEEKENCPDGTPRPADGSCRQTRIACPIGTVLHPDGVCRRRRHDPDNPFTPPVGPPVPN